MNILQRIRGPFAEARYCRWCGDPLVVTHTVDEFDPRTGQAVVERRGDCPRILNGGPFEGYHPRRRSPTPRGQL